MSNQLKRIAEELFDKPLLTQPGYAEKVLNVIAPRIGLEPFAGSEEEYKAKTESNISVSEGVAHIKVFGSLTHRASNLDAPSGLTAYQTLSRDLDEAIASGADTILMEYDTPGGSVAGCFDLADKIKAIADDPTKPRVIAFVNGTCASAGYLLASQANQILATQTSMIGSIGVVVAHRDVSEANKQRGVKIEYIHAGARKVDGNPNAPLSEDSRANIQLSVDKAYERFVKTVSSGRGISAEVIQSTEAATLSADDGLEIRMIDKIVSEYGLADALKTSKPSPVRSAAATPVTYTPKSQPAPLAASAPAPKPKLTIDDLPQAANNPALVRMLKARGSSINDAAAILKAASIHRG